MNGANILIFVGARPNGPKVWTLLRALNVPEVEDQRYRYNSIIVHSGQHYHDLLGEGFVRQFGIKIDKNLGIGSQHSDAEQLAALVTAINQVILDTTPDCVVAVGDVNTTLAAALTASRLSVPVVHLEAGLRSGDWDPEKGNRRVITACSRYHLAPSELAVHNLLCEGIQQERIYLVGNTMAEAFLMHAHQRRASTILQRLGLQERMYVLFTVHKAHNLSRMPAVIDLLAAIAQEIPVVFPCHPHTAKVLQYHLDISNKQLAGVKILKPLLYPDVGRLLEASRCTITDSAGLQEESVIAGVPCLVVGEGTARPETVLCGNNHIIGFDSDRCLSLLKTVRSGVSVLPYWDDQVSLRIRSAFDHILDDIQRTRTRNTWSLRPLSYSEATEQKRCQIIHP